MIIYPSFAGAEVYNQYVEYRDLGYYGGDYHEICGDYLYFGKELIRFNSNEQKLICGDPGVPAWESIPAYQAKYNITNFLQDRGYYFPEFKDENGKIVVYIGEPTIVNEIIVKSPTPGLVKVWRRRKIKKKPLTPALLNNLQNWTRNQLNNKGYACAEVTITADASTGTITLELSPGLQENMPPIDEQELTVLRDGVLRRFDAFQVGKEYNQSLLTLTSVRTETDGIIQSTYFVTECKDDEVHVTQKATPGKPRLVILGIGADTEEYVKGKATWKHARLGPLGSSIRVDAEASYLRQELSFRSSIYFLPKPSRWHLIPTVSFERRNERQYDYISVDTGLLPAYSWDNQKARFTVSFGPNFSVKKTYRGPNTGFSEFFSGVILFSLMSHDYEYYSYNPRNGYNLEFGANFNSRDLLSDVTAQQLSLNGEWIYNVAGFDPPLLILGVRGNVSTTLTDRGDSHFNRLPPDFLYYLGGSQDLRGFRREELPKATRTALSKAFVSLEARLANVFPLWIQPFAFVDFGALGNSSFNLDLPVYWSPGFGMGVYSPFGIFRATFAHGFMIGNNNPVNNPASHWQFYFSFGEVF